MLPLKILEQGYEQNYTVDFQEQNYTISKSAFYVQRVTDFRNGTEHKSDDK